MAITKTANFLAAKVFTASMTLDMIYLDHNSTTPLVPQVAEVMREAMAANYANPASQHAAGRVARRALDDAKQTIAEILGINLATAYSDRIVVTSGGTESNNLAVLGMVSERPGIVFVSAVEHPSVAEPARYLSQLGYDLRIIPVDGQGVVDAAWLRSQLSDPDVARRTQLVSVMLGNNETGVLQPVAEIAQNCRSLGIPVHTDAVQVVGKLAVSFADLGVTAMTVSAHKFHGPRGVGLLVIKDKTHLQPRLHGGSQQLGSRPGTEPVDLVLGTAKALEVWRSDGPQAMAKVAILRDSLQQQLVTHCPTLVVNGGGANRLPHTLNVSFPGLDRQALLMALDHQGVACSTGSACASGSSQPSPVLLAMGCPDEVVEGSLRISLGRDTTAWEIEQAAQIIAKTANRQQRG